MECLSSFDTVPRCDGKKGDPACVCGILEGTSTQDRDEAGKVIKCFVDQCGLTDAAVAITTFTVDCGAKVINLGISRSPCEAMITHMCCHLFLDQGHPS
jgi:hypothetical protein